ncbi:MAG TPA: hypothetical protein VND64_24200 [Pirellulales bacterium]|nr:hypothetical protein [Pirellulales bacterium]
MAPSGTSIAPFDLEDLDDPAHYDLVVNTTRLGVEAAAELVAAAFRARRTGAEKFESEPMGT